ncbi:hypothetical protein VIGAN_06042500 [Vigna angularis var. angularis]|uniref:Uncharacterized protein n=1 Tax=Vigna angularis var. angularis TaxID=157739 RepID=A0A0S3S9C8_PHAAN|nr:hypothetical protein VIGAN_06042500 [Vigna angularis var. angularis]
MGRDQRKSEHPTQIYVMRNATGEEIGENGPFNPTRQQMWLTGAGATSVNDGSITTAGSLAGWVPTMTGFTCGWFRSRRRRKEKEGNVGFRRRMHKKGIFRVTAEKIRREKKERF